MATSPPIPQGTIQVFFSYAHEDERLRDELAKHLSLLENQNVITGWHDRQIPAGNEWAEAIDAHLDSAQIILLLISADFMASKYCYGTEMKRAMTRHKTGEARVIPIILRPVDWYSAPFGMLQALPRDGRPVTSWPNQDEAFFDIARGIRNVVKQIAISDFDGELQIPSDQYHLMSTQHSLGRYLRQIFLLGWQLGHVTVGILLGDRISFEDVPQGLEGAKLLLRDNMEELKFPPKYIELIELYMRQANISSELIEFRGLIAHMLNVRHGSAATDAFKLGYELAYAVLFTSLASSSSDEKSKEFIESIGEMVRLVKEYSTKFGFDTYCIHIMYEELLRLPVTTKFASLHNSLRKLGDDIVDSMEQT